jgi:uncharacterized membrane protein YecN with MAPEG domain
MEAVAIVVVLALIEYVYISIRVGGARGKYGVSAPATTGDPVFERYYRVQQNTVGQLVIFLPSIGLFAYYVMPLAAAGLGLVFIVGRALYFVSYVKEPADRTAGFLMTFGANVILMLGGLIGAAMAMI